MPSGRLSGKVIIVTGSSTGLGEGIARRASVEGASVVVHGIEPDLAHTVAASLGRRSVGVVADLEDPDAPRQIVAEAIRVFGRLDGLVNNAGVSWRKGLEDVDAPFFDRMMAINARAPMLMIQAAMPHLRASGGGSIVNIGSVNAHRGHHTILPYSMSKGALMTMTRCLAGHLAPEGVRINQINPGWVFTPNEDELIQSGGRPPGWHEQMGASTFPLGRIMVPEDLAPMACLLLSDESGMMTGQVIDFNQRSHIG